MNITFKSTLKLVGMALVFTTILFTNACRNAVEISNYDVNLIALTDDNNLISVNSDFPSQITNKVAITGLMANEKMLGIDFRPATGQLYGVGSSSRLYVINATTGAARVLGTAAFTPAINGTIVGFDFNPTVDRIRLVTNAGQNLRLNPETGAVAAIDGNLNPGTPSVSEVAYTNNTAGATTTTLYAIDVNTDKMYIQNPPNNGTLVEVGSLGVDAQGAAGFDITSNGFGFAALNVAGKSELYVVNLTTARVLKLGSFNFGANVIGLSVTTNPVAYAVDDANNLMIFNPYSPSAPISKPITGLQSGENVLGLDMRPVNGQLYALGSTSRLYTINASSGAATVVGTTPFTPALSGTQFGFDFNPTVDRIRIVSNTGQNLRAHPETGVIAAVDGNINPGTPSISAAAYTNNFAGATITTLYVMDVLKNKLYIQNPPNNGTLVEVGNISGTFVEANGFDIGGTSGKAFALLNDEGFVKLFQVNLQNAQLNAGTRVSISGVRGFTMGLGF
jgi:hypothetical protein